MHGDEFMSRSKLIRLCMQRGHVTILDQSQTRLSPKEPGGGIEAIFKARKLNVVSWSIVLNLRHIQIYLIYLRMLTVNKVIKIVLNVMLSNIVYS